MQIHSLNPRSNVQQEEAISLLEHLKGVYTTAQEAVALGDGTLKEANNTYHTLAGIIDTKNSEFIIILIKYLCITKDSSHKYSNLRQVPI